MAVKVALILILTILALAFLTSAGVWAQAVPIGKAEKPVSSPPVQTQPATTLSVQVKVVNVLATVRDKHGKIVNNLTKDDFRLTEDGRPQAIHYFTRENDLPLTLGFLVDTSMSQRRVLDQERSASHTFLDQMVRVQKDKAFIIHFDREVGLLQDLTSSHEKLEAALGSLTTPQFIGRVTTPQIRVATQGADQAGITFVAELSSMTLSTSRPTN